MHAIMDKSPEGGLKSIGNTIMMQKILRKIGNSCRNSHLILCLFLQPGPVFSKIVTSQLCLHTLMQTHLSSSQSARSI